MLAETDENNNILAGNQITISYGADLVMTQISCPETGTRGDNINVLSTAINQGTNKTWTYPGIAIYLSTDPMITTSDICIGGRAIAYLNPGQTNSANLPFRIPSNIAPGTYYIGAIVDVANIQPEDDEGNNSLNGNMIVVQ